MKERAHQPVRILLNILSYCIPSNAGRECVATTLKICSLSGLHSSPDRDVHVGMDLYRR